MSIILQIMKAGNLGAAPKLDKLMPEQISNLPQQADYLPITLGGAETFTLGLSCRPFTHVY